MTAGMLTQPALSGIAALITELRADDDVAAMVGVDLEGRVRVRGGEPVGRLKQAGGQYEGDARGPGDYQRFVVLVTLEEPIDKSMPIFRGLYAARCYGSTDQRARELWGAVVKAVHRVQSRIKANGLGIYISFVEAGGEQDRDPDTKQPLVTGTISIIATAQSVSPIGS